MCGGDKIYIVRAEGLKAEKNFAKLTCTYCFAAVSAADRAVLTENAF